VQFESARGGGYSFSTATLRPPEELAEAAKRDAERKMAEVKTERMVTEDVVIHAAPAEVFTAGGGGRMAAGEPQFGVATGPNVMFRSVQGVALPKPEALGKQMIEGVSADGTRTTLTIEAGEIGNDRPIKTVSERWYSSELQTVVMSKQSDPRSGEEAFRLTGISRTEPASFLFQVPAGYQLADK
jgi:hypothetical protein